MPIIANISVYLTTNSKEADDFIEKIHICRNCKEFTQSNLFGGTCRFPWRDNIDNQVFNVDYDSVCESFETDKITEYWLCKLGKISMDYSGVSDEIRAFMAKEKILNRSI